MQSKKCGLMLYFASSAISTHIHTVCVFLRGKIKERQIKTSITMEVAAL